MEVDLLVPSRYVAALQTDWVEAVEEAMKHQENSDCACDPFQVTPDSLCSLNEDSEHGQCWASIRAEVEPVGQWAS